jgi:hypothetical protein
MKHYRVYAKFNGQSQFKPLDLSRGTQVTNLIYATLVPAENLERLKEAINGQEDAKIEIREAETGKTIYSI